MRTLKKNSEDKAIKIGNIRTTLSIREDVYNKALRKLKKLGYKNFQEYLNELIRRDAFRKKIGGRMPNNLRKAGNVFTMKKVLTTNGKPFSI